MPRRPPGQPAGDPPPAAPARNPLVDDLVKQITKRFGAGSARVLSEAHEPVRTVLPTGIASLDAALGIGGWPGGGKISELWGPEAVGKSTLCKQLAARSIQAGWLTAFLDFENSINMAPAFDAALGLDASQLVLSGPPAVLTIEDGFGFIETFLALATQRRAPGMFFWDSIAATPTRTELETPLEDAARPGVRAFALGRGFTRLMPKLVDSRVGLLFVNQSRERIGALPFQEKNYSPGGMAFHHFCHLRVEMRRRGNIVRGADREIIGLKSLLKIRKSKFASPAREGRMALYFTGRIEDDASD
jgi:recombination protein RecA